VGPTCQAVFYLQPCPTPSFPRAAAGFPRRRPASLAPRARPPPPLHRPTHHRRLPAFPLPVTVSTEPPAAAINGRPASSHSTASAPFPLPSPPYKGAAPPPAPPAPPHRPYSRTQGPERRRRRSSPPEPRPRRRSPPPPCFPPLRPLGKFPLPLLFLSMPSPSKMAHQSSLPAIAGEPAAGSRPRRPL
jgi:hypothetical protein